MYVEKMYKTEEEFLKDYNVDKYDKLSMTADILIFSVSSEEETNYRKTDKKKMSILLVKRENYPFKDKWCLPGGFVRIDENLDDAPKRILKNDTYYTKLSKLHKDALKDGLKNKLGKNEKYLPGIEFKKKYK